MENPDMRSLVDKLNYYTKKYDEGNPEISDKEWDDLYFQLLTLEEQTNVILPDSPTQKISYQVVSALSKVEHNHKMLSLEKTKSIDDIKTFLGNQDFVAMAKMDGLTLSLRYLDGKLISAETRGNGIIGEDVTHNAKVIPSIPKTIDFKEELVVDGEIVCLAADFEQFANEYKNPRNFASGSIRLLDASECSKRKLTFILWDVIKGYNGNSFVEGLSFANKLGFRVVPWVQENSTYAVGDLQDWCGEQGYPIDGIVFKFNDIVYGKSLGSTDHHFKNAMAYKFYDEEYETKLIGIDWSMGRTGILTPVAVFEPVDDGGSIIERASLHNLNIMKELLGEEPVTGMPIRVVKMNMIIPQVVWGDKEYNGEWINRYLIPDICPICGHPTAINDSEQLYCANPDCEGKFLNKLDHFFGKKGLDVKGISKATFEKLIDWGWVENILAVFNLRDFDILWMNKPGFGRKSVEKILDTLDESRMHCPLNKFLCAIGIPQIGTTASKQLADYFGSYTQFREAVNNNFDFTTLPDFGYITAESILHFDYTEADQLSKIINIEYVKNEINNDNGKLKGLKIVITGNLKKYKNRDELSQIIAAAGGKVVSSVTKETNILINNNPNSTSTKNIAAKKLNIPILSEEEFVANYID